MKYSVEVQKQLTEFRIVIETYLKNPLKSHAGMLINEIYDEVYNDMRDEVHYIERERNA